MGVFLKPVRLWMERYWEWREASRDVAQGKCSQTLQPCWTPEQKLLYRVCLPRGKGLCISAPVSHFLGVSHLQIPKGVPQGRVQKDEPLPKPAADVKRNPPGIWWDSNRVRYNHCQNNLKTFQIYYFFYTDTHLTYSSVIWMYLFTCSSWKHVRVS